MWPSCLESLCALVIVLGTKFDCVEATGLPFVYERT